MKTEKCDVRVICGDNRDALKTLSDESANCCITSPPYFGLRDYGYDGQIGIEETPEQFIQQLVGVFREVRRVLRNDGTLWVNIGDTYAGGGFGAANYPEQAIGSKQATNAGSMGAVGRSGQTYGMKPKDLIGIPWMLAFALRSDGWYLRQDIIWHKPNPMPESVTDRCTKSHEYIFLLSKSRKYYYDAEAIKEPVAYSGGSDHRNKRSVWSVPTQPYSDAHFAVFPTNLISPCILAGCPVGGTVLDPFAGSGTTLSESQRLGRHSIGIEANPQYIELIKERTSQIYFAFDV